MSNYIFVRTPARTIRELVRFDTYELELKKPKQKTRPPPRTLPSLLFGIPGLEVLEVVACGQRESCGGKQVGSGAAGAAGTIIIVGSTRRADRQDSLPHGSDCALTNLTKPCAAGLRAEPHHAVDAIPLTRTLAHDAAIRTRASAARWPCWRSAPVVRSSRLTAHQVLSFKTHPGTPPYYSPPGVAQNSSSWRLPSPLLCFLFCHEFAP